MSAKKNQKKPNQTTTAWYEKPLTVIGIILAITALVFIPSLSNDFTNWDDPFYVVNNTLITSLSPEHLYGFFTTSERSLYHPLTMISYAFNYQMAGKTPFIYHLTNWIFHILNTLLVFFFIYRLTDKKIIVAGIVALFFGIHPMHVESVAWISERKDVLFTFFFMAALITYIKYVKEGIGRQYFYTLILFILSVLSKATAVTLAPVLLLVDYYLGRKWTKQVFTEKIPFFLIAAVFGVITIKIQSQQAIGAFETFSIFERLLFTCYGFMMYIVKLFVPINLSAFYPYPTSGITPIYYIAPLIVLLVLAVTTWAYKNWKAFFFGMVFYIFTIALTLQFVSVGGAIMADRYSYIPYIGLLFIIAHQMHDWWYTKDRSKNNLKYGTAGLIGFALLAFSYMTFERCKVWKDSLTLWSNVIDNYDNVPYAHYNRGIVYHYDQEKYQKALKDYNRALKIKPDYADAFYNRGILQYYQFKEVNKAMKDYNAAIKTNPNYADAYYVRGILRKHELNEVDLALDDFTKTLQLKPELAEAWNNRGGLYFNKKKEYQLALDDFNQAIKLVGDNGQYFLNRSYAYYTLGNNTLALKDANKAKSLGFNVPDSYFSKIK